MGMDLRGAGGAEWFSVTSWRKVLELAHEYGWKPAGTEPCRWYDAETGELDEQMSPDPDEWDGTYFSNDLQYVTDEDAANIADALERALDDIPDFDTAEKWVELTPSNTPPSYPLERAMVEQGLEVFGPNLSLTSVEFFSGEAKQKVKDFISYCRAGGFCIG